MMRYMLVACILLVCVSPCSAILGTYSFSSDGLGVFSTSGTGDPISIKQQYINNAGYLLYAEIYLSGDGFCIENPEWECGHRQYYRNIPNMGAPYYLWGSAAGTQDGYNSAYKQVTIPINNYLEIGDIVTGHSDDYVSSSLVMIISDSLLDTYTVSGTFECVDDATLYIKPTPTTYTLINYTESSPYAFPITDGHDYTLIFSDGAYYDFTCDGADESFDYDACFWVYGYTCGVDSIVLRDNNSQIVDQTSQDSGYDVYEMQIEDGEEYTISFYDMGILLCYNQTFTCTGDHVLIDYDRCNWVYPPNGDDLPIYLWTGYDYNVVLLKDNHGNLVENGKLAIYDETDDVYIQKWTDNAEGYALLGAMFPADHDVRMMFRTFDGIFTLDTTYPANGTALVGEEDITTTEWTIPIKYNLNILPVDQYAVPLFDVFCGLSEYTPLDPQAFWGMDLSDRGYVPVTNCSGFAMCDIIAEKEGYADYSEEALNWTSKSAMVKDYRHNVVMEKE